MNKLTQITCCLLFISTAVLAQNTDTLRGGDVIILKEFEPTISEAFKFGTTPQKKNLIIPKIDLGFDIIPKRFESSFTPDSIQAARMKGEPLNRLYRAYTKFGGGNYGTSLFQFHLNNLRSRNGHYGIALDHSRTAGNIKDLPKSEFNTNGVQLHGNHLFRAHELSGNFGFKQSLGHYYGFDKDFLERVDLSSIDDSSLEQSYQNINGAVKLSSFYADSTSWNHQIEGTINHFTNNNDLTETHGEFEVQFDRFFGKDHAIVQGGIDYNDANSAADTATNILINLAPQLVFRGAKWLVNIGLVANLEAQDESKFRFYPNAHFKYRLVDDLLIPYLGVSGGMTRRNNRLLVEENFFLQPEGVILENENKRYQVYGGIRGAYNSKLAFNLKGSRMQLANMAMFVNSDLVNIESSNSFDVIYDTVNITEIYGELSYQEGERIKVIASGRFRDFDPEAEAEVWHLPAFKASLLGRYDIDDKLVLSLDLYYISKQFAKSLDPNKGSQVANGVYAKELAGTFDINIGAEYRLNKKLSAFIQLNNLAAIEYQRYLNYPTQRFSFLAGLTYSFWGE